MVGSYRPFLMRLLETVELMPGFLGEALAQFVKSNKGGRTLPRKAFFGSER